jgi:acetylornithine deacetylase/succinyl-diaminopimelate desuccinylase-like protein
LGAGSKTVIPARAVAKVSIRLVPEQDPAKVVRAFEDFVRANTPAGIRTSVRVLAASPAVSVDPDHPAIRMASQAFSEVFGKPSVLIRSGGSVPIVGDFRRHLGIPTVMLGLGLPDDGLHSPNEKFNLENYYTGIKTVARFLELYGGAR